MIFFFHSKSEEKVKSSQPGRSSKNLESMLTGTGTVQTLLNWKRERKRRERDGEKVGKRIRGNWGEKERKTKRRAKYRANESSGKKEKMMGKGRIKRGWKQSKEG